MERTLPAEMQDKPQIVSYEILCNSHKYFTSYTALSHGDTIAIQTFRRDQWLSCSGLHCGSQGCPGVLFDTDDWRRCWGEVFRIYRAAGPGQIRVGDLVGIYYLNEDGRWLGCAGPYCAKATCPGRPTTENGFASRDHWYRCWGEVFRIYANDKNDTTVINYGDNIMLYYMSGHSWISQGYLGTEKKSCPGSLHPPQHDKFDRCSWEVFLFWKQ